MLLQLVEPALEYRLLVAHGEHEDLPLNEYLPASHRFILEPSQYDPIVVLVVVLVVVVVVVVIVLEVT